MQVCGREGMWWALNAGVLLLYRDLHARGTCSSVKAEVVPLYKVPEPLQRAMVLEGEEVPETDALLPDSSRSTKRGYDRLTATEDDANGNTSPAQPRTAATPATTPSSAAPLTPTSPTTDMDVGSSGSPSLVESSSDCDHYMTQSDTSDSSEDDDEALTCNVCDRAFPTTRLLASHQTRKRHYGCSTCENVFPTLMSLEAHKEETNHWSDDDLFLDDDDDDDDDNDDLDDFYDDEVNEEEREKLL